MANMYSSGEQAFRLESIEVIQSFQVAAILSADNIDPGEEQVWSEFTHSMHFWLEFCRIAILVDTED